MKWSWRIGRIVGIDIHVHATFPLLFAWIALVGVREGATPGAVLSTLALMLAVFAIVVLHECGHALTARRFGIRTLDITLLPIGGVARLERMPRVPRQELLIALAGPAVNVVLALIFLAALAAGGNVDRLPTLAGHTGATTPTVALAQLLSVNVSLAVFNLLPAFPLDGGRALRALLAMRSGDYARATLAAARIGRVFALLFGMAGLFVINSPMLVVIALFVWLAAASEASAVQVSVALEHVPLASLMVTDIRTLLPTDSLAHASELTLRGFQQDFPVVDRERLVGMLHRADLVRGLAAHGDDGAVADAMRRDFHAAAPDDSPEEALRSLTLSGGSSLPVVREGKLLGLLTTDNVMEFMMLRGARRHAPITHGT